MSEEKPTNYYRYGITMDVLFTVCADSEDEAEAKARKFVEQFEDMDSDDVAVITSVAGQVRRWSITGTFNL